jgi:hypothetical protein
MRQQSAHKPRGATAGTHPWLSTPACTSNWYLQAADGVLVNCKCEQGWHVGKFERDHTGMFSMRAGLFTPFVGEEV